MDLVSDLVTLLMQLSEQALRNGQPLVVIFFGNPYAATFLPELPSVLLTYDYRGLAEETVVRALAGEIPIRGRLPVTLGTQFRVGHGLTRSAKSGNP